MCPWRSLVPTIEIVTGASRPGAPAPPSAACVDDATNDNAARQIALRYDARMRVLRGALAALVMTAAACGGGKGGPDASGSGGLSGTGGSGNRFGKTYQQYLNRNVDILFLIDDSSSMGLVQNKLLQDFATFANTLQTLEGGMPDVHIGVISSDMGAGDGTVAGCDSTGGKKGILQYTARGTCTATKLNAGARYISNIGGVANYTGALEDVFRCIGALGESGCGFEHQFAAILRALGADDQPAPAENQGFLRADANLAIVMLTNEDDCSVTRDVPLFDTLSKRASSRRSVLRSTFAATSSGTFAMAPIPSASLRTMTWPPW